MYLIDCSASSLQHPGPCPTAASPECCGLTAEVRQTLNMLFNLQKGPTMPISADDSLTLNVCYRSFSNIGAS